MLEEVDVSVIIEGLNASLSVGSEIIEYESLALEGITKSSRVKFQSTQCC